MPFRAIKSGIADSLDVVVHLERRPGRRLVTEVIEIKGYDPDTDRFACRPVYERPEVHA
jgi:pilus assembly protein CpaF